MEATSLDKTRLNAGEIEGAVQDALEATQCVDMHTHLYPAAFGKIGLWGIDELLTYHYLEAEFFRHSDMTPEHYWTLSKLDQADAIWNNLFVENTPVSEATLGVFEVLSTLVLASHAS